MPRRRAHSTVTILLHASLWVLSMRTLALAQDAPDYIRHVAPLLTKYCTGCHNSQDADGKLALDSFDGIVQGGKRGEAIVPGRSVESRLVLVLEGKAKPAMPPRGETAPTAEEIAVLRAWIDAGAVGPAAGSAPASALITPHVELKTAPRLPANALAISPAGRHLAVGRDRTLEVLLADTRSQVANASGFAGPVNALDYAHDGSLLAAASGEPGLFGELKLFRAVNGAVDTTQVRTFRGHRDCLYAVAISPDGKIVVTAGYDFEIKLWSVEHQELIRTLKGHQGAVFDLAFRPDGRLLASASADRTVKLWNVDTGERLDTFSQPLKDQLTLAFSPAGDVLAAGGADNRIRIWKISPDGAEGTNPIVHSRFAHEGSILKLVYSPDGRFLASSADDRTVKIWEAQSVVERQLLEPQSDWPAALGFADESRTLVVGRLDGTVEMYDAERGQPIRLSRGPVRALGTLATVALLAFLADTPKPEILAVQPRGLERGKSGRFLLTGKALAAGAQLKLHSPKLTGRLLDDPPGKAEEIWVELTAAPDAERGAHEFAVITPGGESDRVRVHIDDLAQAAEAEPDTLASALAGSPRPLPACWWGALTVRGDQDHFAFDLGQGETIILDVAGTSLGSKANLVTALFDASGRVVAASNDFDGSADPLIVFTASTTGRYALRVADLELNASADHFYRVTAGVFPFVAGSFPVGVPRETESSVALVGWNLPSGATVKVKAGSSGEVEVPIETTIFRARRGLRVAIGNDNEDIESEPNDSPAQADSLRVPGAVNGRIWREERVGSNDVDFFRLDARGGETLVLQTEAASRGTPCDTKIEVLDSEGRPILRTLLQAVRDSYLTFRGIDSSAAGDFRLKNWEEMQLNQYVYLQGEVIKLFRAPQGPDSGFIAYSSSGRRRAYFATSAIAHAQDEPCYVVEPHPPGTKLISNGLPVFEVPFANDDDADRALGTDSRLLFTAPSDGTYLVRVSDSAGHDGPRHAYRLLARRSEPGFHVTLHGANPAVGAGSGRGFSVTVNRRDGFDGPVTVRIDGVPEGFVVSSPVVIEAGHSEARGTIFARPDAKEPPGGHEKLLRVTAEASINGQAVTQDVNSLGTIKLEPRPRLLVRLEPVAGASAITIAPGQMVPAMLRIERHGHDDLVTFQVDNLPHGVIVDDIGLSGVLIRKGENERQIFLAAASWVDETDRHAHAVENQAGAQTSPPVLVQVRRR